MERQFISGREYSEFLETTRWADDNNTTVDRIIDIFEYLKDKKTEKRNYPREPRAIENAHLDFLRIALDRIYFDPFYNKGTEEFLKSDYLSEELKKEINDVLNGNCSEDLMELLTSEKRFQEFSKEEIKEIGNSLHRTCDKLSNEQKKKKCGEIYEIYDDYIFVIDGIGPIEYTKEKNGAELPIIMLEKTSLPSHASYYSGYGVDSRYLGEKHLFSLYKKFAKFYPDKKEEFVKMVENIRRLTPTEFVTNYLSFVRNGLDSNFKNKNGNISVDGLHAETRDLVGALSIFSLFHNESDNDRSDELERHFLIRNEFFKMIDEFESVRKLAESKEKGNMEVLSRKIKQDSHH